MSKAAPRVLVTGATGFVGSHLFSALEREGFDVVGGTRDPDEARTRAPGRTFRHVDLDRPASVAAALAEVDSAVYLVHSMGGGRHYAEAEQKNAHAFRAAAERRGLERIVYLGGMRPSGAVSRHLKSRLATGETLRAGRVPTVELQATMVVGGGSESFRIVRDLAARLPFMLLPRWLESRSQPVAIADVAAAIVHALQMPLEGSTVLAVPGPESLTGRDMILRTARALGHDPKVLGVPLVTPRLSSYWIRWVTRANPQVATELVEGLRSNIVADGPEIWDSMPDYPRTPFDEAVAIALREEARALPMRSRVLERALNVFSRQPSAHPS